LQLLRYQLVAVLNERLAFLALYLGSQAIFAIKALALGAIQLPVASDSIQCIVVISDGQGFLLANHR
jgi:hypothetical protein